MSLAFKHKIHLISWGLFLVPNLYSQSKDTLPHPINTNRFSINAHYIYNFNSNKKEVSNNYPTGTPTNYSGAGIDSVYYEKHKYNDASSFGFNIAYNQRILKRVSISFGIGLNQKKEITKYIIFDDRSPSKSDLDNIIFTKYSIVNSVCLNYYYKRWIFGFGNSFAYNVSQKSINTYKDQSKKDYNYKYSPFNIYLNESISYQIINNKGLYLKLSVEQNSRFYYSYGYNNWFMVGVAYYF
ncbi:MAG: hypothetical protein IT237_05740 [Bacteroidia bacterium]|nr:hypothetical protein [Bacteroidia bacterium]